MLQGEAIRLVLQPEQSHEGFTREDLAAASSHDRRHADAQAVHQDSSLVHSRRAALRRIPGRSPDTATEEDLRRYRLHCVDRGISPITLNATITGLKFFFEVTLKRPERLSQMSHVRVARTLPVILSRKEASRLIESARTLKHRTALSVAYGAGLRVSEVIALKVGDIDSERMLLRIEKGKGQKDRYALLPPILLERLRTWWRYARAEDKVLRGGYLFPGLDPMDSLLTSR